LDSDTQEQWDIAGNHAKKKLEQYPHLCSFLDEIIRVEYNPEMRFLYIQK
jgi:hypothetical protein